MKKLITKLTFRNWMTLLHSLFLIFLLTGGLMLLDGDGSVKHISIVIGYSIFCYVFYRITKKKTNKILNSFDKTYCQEK